MFVAGVLSSCQETINYPAPTIGTISPTSVSATQSSFNLTVTGTNLTPASTVNWGSEPLPTLFQSITSLSATVPATLLQNPGTVNITITTPTPGGGTSPALMFTINPTTSAVPHISSISPTTVQTNGGSFTLDVTGTNFVTLSNVIVNGSVLPTSFESATSLEVSSVPAAYANSAGLLQVVVVNPPPGGGSSNSFTLTVANPVPTIASISPTNGQAGGSAGTLTVTGASFATNAVILFNGSPRVSTVASATSMTTLLTPADFLEAGVNQIQVINPSPGGGASNILPLSVSPTDSAGLPVLVDVAPDGTQASSGICGGAANCASGAQGLTLTTSGPSVNMTGEFVAFASISGNLLTNQTNSASEIYLRDTCLGVGSCTPTTFALAISASGGVPNGPSSEPTLDSSGTDVAYTSLATNLVNYVNVSPGSSVSQIYWQPACSGSTGPCSLSTTTTGSTTATSTPVLVSIAADSVNPGNGNSYNPSISADGRYVAFVSLATNLVSNVQVDGVTPQVFLRDTCTGVTPLTQSGGTCIPVTYLVSSPDGVTPGNGSSSRPVVSNLGAYVAFQSSATNLGSAAPNPGIQEVFEQTECQITTPGCTPTMALMSTPDGTTASAGSEPAISFDGRFIAFASAANNLGANGVQQIYARDTCIGAITTCNQSTILVSSENGSVPGNNLSEYPSINSNSSGSGQFIAFASLATNFGANVANGVENIFVRDTCLSLVTTTTSCAPGLALASQGAGSSPSAANGNSVMPAVSGDGHTVAFLSFASNLVARDTNSLEDIFLGRDIILSSLLGIRTPGVRARCCVISSNKVRKFR